jgi:hypothetical protein
MLICKDFTSVLSMNRDARATVLAALREVYDGSWTRHVGTDGGRTLAWSGKVALMAGCTTTIDNHHAVMGTMGERFVLYRLPPVDEQEQTRRALRHVGQEGAMRQELADVVAGLFAGLDLPTTPAALTDAETSRLVELATLAARCRSAVERDGHSREIELIPDPEAPSRIALTLARLLHGMTAIGVPGPEAWRIVVKVALDCMPALRRKVFLLLAERSAFTETTAIATAVGYPTQTARRTLEDFTAHGVVARESGGGGKADRWALSAWARERYANAVTVPEMSGAPCPNEHASNLSINPHHTEEDFSGTVSPPPLLDGDEQPSDDWEIEL